MWMVLSACESKTDRQPNTPRSATPLTNTAQSAAPQRQKLPEPKANCVPALDASSKTARLFGIGSHALAKTDVTIDLASGKMTGTTYELDGRDVKPIAVDDTLKPVELNKLRDALKATCIEAKTPTGKPQPVPGGHSYIELVSGTGTVWVMFGTPCEKLPVGARYASVTREDWKRITTAYPKMRPSERGTTQPE